MTGQLSMIQRTQLPKVDASGLALADHKLDMVTPAQNLAAF
jgi:hypothetical protein